MRRTSIAFLFVLMFSIAVQACGSDSDDANGNPADGDTDSSDGDMEALENEDEDGDFEQAPDCNSYFISTRENGLALANACGDSLIELSPSIKVDGEWLDSEGCDPKSGQCGFSMQSGGSEYKLTFAMTEVESTKIEGMKIEAEVSGTLQAVAFEGKLDIEGARAWLSNGFQSWSQSGVLQIMGEPAEEDVRKELDKMGDTETMREGKEFSWWYSYVGGGEMSLVSGILSTHTFKSWIQVYKRDGDVYLRLVMGDTGENIAMASGDEVALEDWYINAGTNIHAMLEEYGKAIPSRRHEVKVEADSGWNSWYDLWAGVSEQDVRENAPLAKQVLEDKIPEGAKIRIVVDDGWQQGWGDWYTNEKFPSGLDGLAADLKADGFEVGVWLAPLLVHESSQLVVDHPDWFVQGTTWRHISNGKMFILDPTVPEAYEHLKSTIARIAGWGMDFLKIDFLFSGTFNGTRAQDVTGMQAYHLAMQAIREGAGEDTILLAVGAPGQPSFPYVDAWRLGSDIAFETGSASWLFMNNQARSVAAHYPLCYATLCDADPVLLRDLPINEVSVGGWIVAFAAGALFLSDDLRNVDEERWDWGFDESKAALSVGAVPSLPQDLFPEDAPEELANLVSVDAALGINKHIWPRLWETPDGRRIYVNYSEDATEFESLSIPARTAVELP